MIAAWEVVAVLVPLCSASAYTGYVYAKQLSSIEHADPEKAVPATPAEPPPAPASPPARTAQRSAGDDAIDLSERLSPFGPARHKPAS